MSLIHSIKLFFRSVGVRKAFSILRYTQLKSKLDREYNAALVFSESQIPGDIQNYRLNGNHLTVDFDHAQLEIVFLTDDLACLTWQPGSLPPPYAIKKIDWPEIFPQLIEDTDGLFLSTNQLKMHIYQDGAIDFSGPDGQLLRANLPPSFIYVTGIRPDQEQIRWTDWSQLNSQEHLLGLGEHNGPLDLRGHTRLIWNQDPGGNHGPETDPIYMPLPVYLSLKEHGSYLVFYENSFRATFSFDTKENPGKTVAKFEGGALRYYFISAPPAQALKTFMELTGRPPLPPRWSLGYHQSRWGYKSEKEIHEIAAGFHQHDIPISAIHLDIDYMDGYRIFSVNRQSFPNLKQLSSDLRAQNIHLVAILDPGVKIDPQNTTCQDGNAQNCYVKLPDGELLSGSVWAGDSFFPDFTCQNTRRWWGEQIKILHDWDIDGLWQDMNEPASFTISADKTLPLAAYHDLDGQHGDHLQAHNLYGLQMNRASYEGLLALDPQDRPWIVSRSGWVANARYAWNWTGDVESSWEGLRQTVATMLGASMSGIPFIGSDIGGFMGDPGPELYLRWLQMATFTPFMRTHSATGTARREPWVFGNPFTDIIRRFIELRYQLIPYLYTTAWQCTQTGWPMIRPIFWDEPGNRLLWDCEDSFLCGDALLVAPVLDAGATQRKVGLPAGSWSNFWTDEIVSGPATLHHPVTIEQLPVFIRCPAIIPLAEKDGLALHIYIEPDSFQTNEPFRIGQLYSDSGDGYGPHRLDEFVLRRNANEFYISWQSTGDYPFPYQEFTITIHGKQPDQITIDSKDQLKSGKIKLTRPFSSLTLNYK